MKHSMSRNLGKSITTRRRRKRRMSWALSEKIGAMASSCSRICKTEKTIKFSFCARGRRTRKDFCMSKINAERKSIVFNKRSNTSNERGGYTWSDCVFEMPQERVEKRRRREKKSSDRGYEGGRPFSDNG